MRSLVITEEKTEVRQSCKIRSNKCLRCLTLSNIAVKCKMKRSDNGEELQRLKEMGHDHRKEESELSVEMWD